MHAHRKGSNDKFAKYFQSRALAANDANGNGYLGIHYSHTKEEQ